MRAIAPYGVLLASITYFLLALWTIIYITSIYEEPYIKIPRNDSHMFSEDEELYYEDRTGKPASERKPYYRMSKGSYILWNTLFDFINAALFLCLFFIIKCWVDENEDREQALDNTE